MALFAASPLLVLYVLTHSSWLKTQLPESKEMAVVYLIVLPLAWFACIMALHSWIATRRHDLHCSQCRVRLAGRDYERAMRAGGCPSCGAKIGEVAT